MRFKSTRISNSNYRKKGNRSTKYGKGEELPQGGGNNNREGEKGGVIEWRGSNKSGGIADNPWALNIHYQLCRTWFNWTATEGRREKEEVQEYNRWERDRAWNVVGGKQIRLEEMEKNLVK